jgi:hypothetical protein
MSVLTVPTTRRVHIDSSEKCQPPFLSLLSAKKNISLEERVTLLLVRDLVRVGWRLKSNSRKSIELVPPDNYDKDIIMEAMAYSRDDLIERNASWIEKQLSFGRSNLATGNDVLRSDISPRVEVCETEQQKNLFRIFRYYWSSPASEYVGRRIRLLIRDDGIKGSPVIGIAALGSSIIHIPERDKWIGWDTETRTKRIIYMMDAYVIGAMPPYNYLLGGKLVSYILASNEIRAIYKEKYLNSKTLLNDRVASDLVLIMTTSLYGTNSSQYNRLTFGKSLLYKPIGATSGFGSLHISNETFMAMRDLAEANGCNTSNRFGMGPNWRMRVIRSACDALSLNSEAILRHSFRRGLFAVRLARNFRSFLKGEVDSPLYRNLPLHKLAEYWHERWLKMRRQNDLVLQKVRRFSPGRFKIEKTPVNNS